MKRLLSGIVFGCLSVAAPASAAEIIIPMSGSGDSGADGNARFFSGTSGGKTVNVRVSGWSLDGTTVRDSFLGAFGAAGLGVTSGDDNGGSANQHTIDNEGRRDFVLLQFNQTVRLLSGTFTTYGVLGNARDSDATFGFGTTTADWRSQLALNEKDASVLAAMFSGGGTSLGTGTGGTRDLRAGGAAGNLWLLGADFANADRTIDGFKLSAITLGTVSAVPEPATWGMMLIGFGAVGATMRRRPQAKLALA